MARRLRASGERVAFLALFDTWAPGHGELIPEKFLKVRVQQYRKRIDRFFKKLAEGGKARYLREKLRVRLKVMMGQTSTLPPNLQRLRDSIEQAADEYQPEPYSGAVTLFRASHQPPEYALDRTLGWAALVDGGVEVHEVPGFHGEIVQEPQATTLAEQVRDCLDRTLAAEREAASAPPARQA
jgi:thioesterase domain-containing protein